MRFVDTYQLVSELKHVISQTNNDELGATSSSPTSCLQMGTLALFAYTLLNVLAYNRHVLIVQSRVYLIHAVQWARLKNM